MPRGDFISIHDSPTTNFATTIVPVKVEQEPGMETAGKTLVNGKRLILMFQI